MPKIHGINPKHMQTCSGTSIRLIRESKLPLGVCSYQPVFLPPMTPDLCQASTDDVKLMSQMRNICVLVPRSAFPLNPGGHILHHG